MSQYSARLEISMNSSTSKISLGIFVCSPFLGCSEFVWFCLFYLLRFFATLFLRVDEIVSSGPAMLSYSFMTFLVPWN